MSSFKINVTPTRFQNARKRSEDREPTEVVLAPFSAKAAVTFENIPVTKTARRYVNIINPSDLEIKVMVTRNLSADYNIQLEWTAQSIPANSQVSMEIVWNPLQEIMCKETLQLSDSRNFKKDVSIILKSIKNDVKNIKRFPNVSSATTASKSLKPKLQSVSHQMETFKPKTQTSTVLTATSRVKYEANARLPADRYHSRQYSNKISQVIPQITFTNVEKVAPTLGAPGRDELNFSEVTSSLGKENISPIRPRSASSLFGDIQFTPTTDIDARTQSHIDYLASLPTPVNDFSPKNNLQCDLNPRRLAMVCSPNSGWINNVSVQESSAKTQSCISAKAKYSKTAAETTWGNNATLHMVNNGLSDESGVVRTVNCKNLGARVSKTSECEINDKTFDANSKTVCSENVVSFLNTTRDLSVDLAQSLPVIDETQSIEPSDSLEDNNFQKTFDMSKTRNSDNLKHDIILFGKPLLKQSESMKDLSGNSLRRSMAVKGSMPNLSEMEEISPIEENRYYRPEKNEIHNCETFNLSTLSTVSNAELLFNQNEILAQSSRYNVNEIGMRSAAKGDPRSQKLTKTPSPSDVIIGRRVNSPKNQLRSPAELQKRTREHTPDSPISTLRVPITHTTYTFISPPKRSRIDSNLVAAFASNVSRTPRSKKWARLQPKNLRSNRLSTPGRSTGTPYKMTPNPEILYNSNAFLQAYINPDPFAATTTCDPYLTPTMYLDERAVANHEVQFKKWLNALVAIPSEFDSDCGQKIDVGRLFNEVRNKNLILAPTKEEQSMNYLTKVRMDSLRRAAVQLYMSPEIIEPCSKVAVLVNKKSLRIRTDRDLHLDIVLQRNILELLLTFNPLWLRIGLEVVFGETIHLHSNSDVVGLSTFILNRLFRDRTIEQQYSRSFALSEEYSEKIKKFSLSKILFLLFFLDNAKTKKIIKHNPCLFVKSSKYKETREILLHISSGLIANIGDITRYLRRVGYVLTHKQTFLDEFNYAFNNLAVDLRDGVRITRVMEIILLREDLTQQLRVPAISRLQRIFNVNLALKALREADFTLSGDINATDIVDGRREKTLSLLWQIIYKFRAPKFNAAAAVIQKWWRKSWLKVVIRRRIRRKLELRREKAAIVIQSAYRGYMSRRFVQVYRWEMNNLAIRLQKYARRYLAQKRFHQTMKSIVCIQRWYRRATMARTIRQNFLYVKFLAITIQRWYRGIQFARKLEASATVIRQFKTEAKLRHEKAIIIQRYMKSYTIRKKLQAIVAVLVSFNRKKNLEHKCATKIQSYYRMSVERKEFLNRKQAINTIKKHWCAFYRMKMMRAEYLSKRSAAIKIQRIFRSYLLMKQQRQDYQKLRLCATAVQRRFRANKIAAYEREQYLSKRRSAIAIQRRFRATLLMHKIRGEYLTITKCTIQLQQRYRAWKAMVHQKEEYQKLKTATIIIQQRYRAQLLMRKHRTGFLQLRENTVRIQVKYRATMLARKHRSDFLSLCHHVTKVQQRFRANQLMRNERYQFLQLKESVIKIQRRFRTNLLMKMEMKSYQRLKAASIVIQRRFRAHKIMRIERAKFLGKREAALHIQQRFRDYLLMKHTRIMFLKLKKAATVLQRRFRAKCLMETVRKEYRALRNAAVVFQRRFRAQKLMKQRKHEFQQLKTAAIVFQRRYRAKLAGDIVRNDYQTLKYATIVLQRRLRAQIEMKKERVAFLELRNATIVVQRRYRANKCMEECHSVYIRLKHAALVVQRRFRAKQLGSIEHTKYTSLKRAAIVIQQRFRAQMAMKISQTRYLELRNATNKIQLLYRAKKLMQISRSEYLKMKSSAVLIQRWFRATIKRNVEHKNYIDLRKATLVIQERFRAHRAMQAERMKYLQFREKVLKIQQRFRANRMMQINRAEFIREKAAAVLIQRFFRAVQLRNFHQTEYNKYKNAAITIQRKFRAHKNMRMIRKEYMKLKAAAICIQILYRSKKMMEKFRGDYVKLKSQAILVQRRYRAKVVGEQARKEFLSLKAAAINIQRRFRAQILMKQQSEKYQNYRHKIINLQRYIRGYLLMKKQRREFLIQKDSAIQIQRWFRGVLLTRKMQRTFKNIQKCVLIIQIHLRATLKMIKERKQFLLAKEAAQKIQCYFRPYQLMKKHRSEFLILKKTVVLLQRRYRAKKEMQKCRSQFLLVKSSVTCIQRKYRANQAMKVERAEFLQLKSAAITIQQKFRGRYLTEIYRQNFIDIRKIVNGLQSYGRGYLARKRFNELMTTEMRENIRRRRAARTIQRYWRGYVVRKRWRSVRIKVIREKILALKANALPGSALKYKVTACVKLLKGRFNITEAMSVLLRLENLSRTVPQTLREHAEFIATFCYGIMAQAIRSEAHKQIIEICSRVILNLARYYKENLMIFQENGLVTIAQMLLRWCDKDCSIFNTLCTLIWIFSHCPQSKKKIREFMTTHESMFMVRETKKLVLRKENMRKNVRKLNIPMMQQQFLKIEDRKNLPSLEPDFGVVRNNRYIFNCSVFAFDTVLHALEITVI